MIDPFNEDKLFGLFSLSNLKYFTGRKPTQNLKIL